MKTYKKSNFKCSNKSPKPNKPNCINKIITTLVKEKACIK